MDNYLINKFLEDLKNPDQEIRDRATAEFWKYWFLEKGEVGLNSLEEAQFNLDLGDFKKAEEILNHIIETQPDFTEAWNRRAVLYYTLKDYLRSKQDCQKVVELMPIHFGAWHGLGLCNFALENYLEAIAAFRKALEIQPYALINQKLILECTTRLN